MAPSDPRRSSSHLRHRHRNRGRHADAPVFRPDMPAIRRMADAVVNPGRKCNQTYPRCAPVLRLPHASEHGVAV